MLSFARTVLPTSSLGKRPPTFRSFAQVINTTASPSPPPAAVKRTRHALGKGRFPVREDHGLYAFFRRKEPKEGEELVGDAKYEVVETPEKMQKVTGKSSSFVYSGCDIAATIIPKGGHGGQQSYG